VDAFPPPDDNIAVDVDVDGAVVVATVAQTSDPVPQARADFWVADENQILSVHLDRTQGPSCCPSFDLRTGMELSFKVTRVNVAFSLGVVVEATDFVAGDQDRCVSVEDVASITIADFSRVVRLTGTLTGEPISNDSYQYWDLDLGNSNMVEFRSGNPNRMTGQRITWVGPVGTVAGIPFLTELNSDWVMVTE